MRIKLWQLDTVGAVSGNVPVYDQSTDSFKPGSPTALTVQDENLNVSTAVTQIDFQGAGVTATAGTGEVIVTIPGVGTASGELLMADGVTSPPVPIETEAGDDWLYQD